VQQANDFHKVGELLRIRDRHRLFLYDVNDPERMYYEKERLDGPSLMIVLDVFVLEDEISPLDDKVFSYKVLTTRGTYHIQAWSREHQYSYYESL
jgi:hypothetical protein